MKINKYITTLILFFPHTTIITYFVLILELITYKGFILKYLFIPSDLIYYLSLISIAVLSYFYTFNKSTKVNSSLISFLRINQYFFIPLILANYLLISLELSNYPNYVFSKYHLIPENFSKIIILNSFLILLDIFLKKLKTIKVSNVNFFKVLFYFVLAIFLIGRIEEISKKIYSSMFLSVKAISLPFDKRFTYKNGEKSLTSWVYNYSQFIVNNTAPNSIIFIPLQKNSWLSTGNKHYMRGFLYPRVLLQDKVDEYAEIPNETEFILISYGEWISSDHVWPKVNIDKEKIDKIIYIDRNTLETYEVYDGYNYLDHVETWGIIKLKK